MANDISRKFLTKLNLDTRSRDIKLRDIGLCKNTYIAIKRGSTVFKKKTVETMQAYLDGRRPKFELIDKEKEFYCCVCETGRPLANKYDEWTCRKCVNKKRTILQRRNKPVFLMKHRNRKLRKKYGQLWQCMRSIIELRKELRDEKNKEERIDC